MSFPAVLLKVMSALRDIEGYLLLLFAVAAFAMHVNGGPFTTRVIDLDYFWLALLCLTLVNSLFWCCRNPDSQN